jgi:hypothetical protein
MSGAVFAPFAATLLFAPTWPVTARAAPQPAARRVAEYHGGLGRIAGTVKQAGTPDNTPLRRKVWLMRERDGMVIDEVWSDAATGGYVFEYVDPAQRYTVLAFDHERHFRAVIADNIPAEAM